MLPTHRPKKALLVASAVLVAVTTSGAAASEVETVDYWHPKTFSSTKDWNPSNRTRLGTAGSSAFRNDSLTLTPRTSSTSKVIAISKPIQRAGAKGTRVTAQAKLRSTMRNRWMSVELREIDRNGSIVQKKRTYIHPGHTRWRAVSSALTLRASTSRLTVRVAGASVEPGQTVRLNALRVSAKGAASASPRASSGQAVQRGADVAPLAATTCQALDYSSPAQGTLSWQDEFDGTSVDPTKWRVRDKQSLSYDLARIQKENVSVANGILSIAARKESAGGRDYTSGYLDSIGKFSQQYGRWEMRAKVPTKTTNSRGIWPAFWLRADGSPGEIDVMESWGEPTTRSDYRSGSYQWTVWEDTTKTTSNAKVNGWGTPAGSPPISDDWHTYAVDWSPDCMRFTFDGKVAAVVDAKSTPWLTTAFTTPVNIRLNMQVGQDYWGNPITSGPQATTFPATLDVDYVRAYKPR